jgi:hypothetical protein
MPGYSTSRGIGRDAGQSPSHRRRARTRGQALPGGPPRETTSTAGQRYLHGRAARSTWTPPGAGLPNNPQPISGKATDHRPVQPWSTLGTAPKTHPGTHITGGSASCNRINPSAGHAPRVGDLLGLVAWRAGKADHAPRQAACLWKQLLAAPIHDQIIMPITPPPPQHRRDGRQGPTIDPPGPTKNPGHSMPTASGSSSANYRSNSASYRSWSQ